MRVDKIKIMTRQNNKQAKTKQEKNLKLTIPSVGKDAELGLSFIEGRKAKWYKHSGRASGSF